MSKTHYKSLIETEYLGQWDFPAGRDVTVEIKSVDKFVPKIKRMKKVGNERVPEPNKRLMIGFQRTKKKWLAGPATQETLVALFGPHVEDWIGQKITLYVDPNVSFGRRKIGGVRVRPVSPSGPTTDDALDRPVDEEKAEELAKAFADEVGE